MGEVNARGLVEKSVEDNSSIQQRPVQVGKLKKANPKGKAQKSKKKKGEGFALAIRVEDVAVSMNEDTSKTTTHKEEQQGEEQQQTAAKRDCEVVAIQDADDAQEVNARGLVEKSVEDNSSIQQRPVQVGKLKKANPKGKAQKSKKKKGEGFALAIRVEDVAVSM